MFSLFFYWILICRKHFRASNHCSCSFCVHALAIIESFLLALTKILVYVPEYKCTVNGRSVSLVIVILVCLIRHRKPSYVFRDVKGYLNILLFLDVPFLIVKLHADVKVMLA